MSIRHETLQQLQHTQLYICMYVRAIINMYANAQSYKRIYIRIYPLTETVVSQRLSLDTLLCRPAALKWVISGGDKQS